MSNETFNPGDEVWFLTRQRLPCGESEWSVGRGVVAHEQRVRHNVEVETFGRRSLVWPGALYRSHEAAEAERLRRTRCEIEAMIDEHRGAIEALELRLAKLETKGADSE